MYHKKLYKNIQSAARSRPSTLSPLHLQERLHPHTPNDPAEWDNWRPAALEKLPRQLQVLCGLTAVEMVWPAAQEWAPAEEQEAIQSFMKAAREYINGRRGPYPTFISRTVSAVPPFWLQLRQNPPANEAEQQIRHAVSQVFAAALALVNAIDLPKIDATLNGILLCVSYAAQVWEPWGMTSRDFHWLWWARCKGRLAVANLPQTHLEVGRRIGSRTAL